MSFLPGSLLGFHITFCHQLVRTVLLDHGGSTLTGNGVRRRDVRSFADVVEVHSIILSIGPGGYKVFDLLNRDDLKMRRKIQYSKETSYFGG